MEWSILIVKCNGSKKPLNNSIPRYIILVDQTGPTSPTRKSQMATLLLTHFKLHEMEVKYITVDNVLKEKMRKMELYNKIYEW